MTKACLKQLRFAFSPDNDDNIRPCLFLAIATVLSVVIGLLVPYIGYVSALMFNQQCPGGDVCICLNTTLTYGARYCNCLLSAGYITLLLILILLLGVGVFLIWKFQIPLLRAEIAAASIPPPKREEDDDDDEEEDENTHLFTRARKQSLWWLVSTDNPNRLFRQGTQSGVWGLIILVIIAIGPMYVLGACTGSLFNTICQNGPSWLCSTKLPCNVSSTTLVDFVPACATTGTVGMVIGIAIIVLIFAAIRACYAYFHITAAAFKKPEEIDSIRALKTMERAII